MGILNLYRFHVYLNGLQIKNKVNFDEINKIQNMLFLVVSDIYKENTVLEFVGDDGL
jgi:hypothetical protein